MKLAIISTHPIQYYSPLFQQISRQDLLHIKVYYTWGVGCLKKYDPGFGKEIQWDIPLLDGYDYTFVKNTSKKPGSNHFLGIINPTLNQEISAWKPDAILVYGWPFFSHLKAMLHFKGKIPIFFRGDSNLLDNKFGIRKIIRHAFLKWVYRYIDYSFYVGSNNKKYYLKNGLGETNLIWAPHSIDNIFFTDIDGSFERSAIQWRKKLKLKETDILLVYVGKFSPVKNLLNLVETFKSAKKDDIYLLLVGNGILEQQLKKEADKNVLFLPFQNQSTMPIIYRMADVFILPSSLNETWGLSVNEAMTCGKAIITSNKVGCAKDLVKRNYNGYIFDINNLSELKDIIQLDLNKNSLSKMGLNSLKLISDWSVKNTADIITKTILEKCDS